MTQLQEKRRYARYDGEGPITLVSADSQSRQFEAGLLNFSAEGISFFSNRPLKPGTTIIVRASVENYQHVSADVDCQLRSVGVATIKWCQQGNREGRPIHEMGAVYMMAY
ncbi:PilZ domain-containing protein [uncultured Desulfosarcina sp.]|uniref:PilZ domain-containing protein n=1 Tax=uncultured Desulfosarcina sp. TaxID=218289 RepID=UPI0029C98CA2|nr:PilZ domain-containing protein [uncultured Desulfosarcina sp.]